MQIVWYFEKPTIGFCPDCQVIAFWTQDKGLYCPNCQTQKISEFSWEEGTRHPETYAHDLEEETEEEEEPEE